MKLMPHTAGRWYGVLVTVSLALSLAREIGAILGEGAWAAWALFRDCGPGRVILEWGRSWWGG